MKTMILLQQKIMNNIHAVYNRISELIQVYLDKHPYITLCALIIGLTLFILTVVTLLTIVLILPVSLIFGWV